MSRFITLDLPKTVSNPRRLIFLDSASFVGCGVLKYPWPRICRFENARFTTNSVDSIWPQPFILDSLWVAEYII